MTDNEHAGLNEYQSMIPASDPSFLTTEALTREVEALKALLSLRIESSEGSSKKAYTSLKEVIKLQHELRDEKFRSIDRELHLVEAHRIEQKQDALASLAAALSAAKEAVRENTLSFEKSIAKTENATNDQLRQLNATITTAIDGVLRGIADIKERVNKAEQALATHVAAGVAGDKATDKFQPWVISIVMTLVAVASIIIQLSH